MDKGKSLLEQRSPPTVFAEIGLDRSRNTQSKSRHSFAPTKASRKTLVITVVKAHDLEDLQLLAAQDPYVSAQLLKTDAEAHTHYVWGGGTAPNWESTAVDGSNVMVSRAAPSLSFRTVLVVTIVLMPFLRRYPLQRLSYAKRTVAKADSPLSQCRSLERQNAESFPNSLLLEVMNSNIFIDDKLAFAVLNFSKDGKTVWVEHPTNGTPSKTEPATIADGAFTLSLARPVETSVGEGTSSSRRQRSGGRLTVRICFE